MKTIEEFLKELPDGEREKALQNSFPENLKAGAYDMADALEGAFVWKESPEGWEYWYKISERYWGND